MGIEAVVIGLIATATVGKISTAVKSSELEMSALELQSKQKTIEFQQRSLRNYDQVKKVVDAQTATASALGYGGGSPSLLAIQTDTFRTGAAEQENIDIENRIAQLSIENEKKSVKNSLYSKLFGTALEVGFGAFSLAQKAPSKPRS